MYQVTHYIHGQKCQSSGQALPIFNPASGEEIASVVIADKAIIEQSIVSAKNAFPSWSTTPPLKRARILFKFKDLLEKNIDELSAIITREHGKTLVDAQGSVQRGIDVVEFACGIPAHLKGIFTEEVSTHVDSYSLRQALGVCVGITPFNFPAMVPLWMFAIAIACGNTYILKPSEKDPSCAIRLAELATEAGLPPGILNVVQGDGSVVDLLLAHPNIEAVSFVGSTPVAKHVFKTATVYGKRVQAFGSAKNHAIVMPDADLEQTADAVVGAAYGSAGERCMAISVVVVVGNQLADQLVEKIKTKVGHLKIGQGTEVNSDIGPLVTQAHWQRVKSYVDIGVEEGAQLVIDGREFKKDQGFYFGACLFDHVTPVMRIYKEEIFGPVLSIVRVKDFNTALTIVNEHEYGNGATIFTRDGEAARTFASKVQAGMVGINVPIPVPVAYHSFGGWKHSMFGDIGMHGMEGVQFFTRLKTVTQKWLISNKGSDFGMPIL